MFYKLLGMFVWRGAKLFLRRKYGRTYVPVPLLAGGLVAVLLVVLLIHARRGSDDLI
jgi:hypothetical protein